MGNHASSSLPCLYLNQIKNQWKSHGTASPHPRVTCVTKFYLNQIIIYRTRNAHVMGKPPSSSCINFYLNQINCTHPRHDVLTRCANIWKQKTWLRKSQQPNLMRKYINQNPISANEIGWCSISMLTDAIEWCILCGFCDLCNLCDLCNVCKPL